MSRYAQLEVDEVREIAKQETSDEDSQTEAVSRNLILRFLSDADERIQSRVLESPDVSLWDDSEVITTVASQREYDLPENIYAGDNLKLVEFSSNGQARSYRPLMRAMRSQLSNESSQACIDRYCTVGGQLVVSPIPLIAGQLLRLTFTKIVDRLDIRRGKISVNPANDGTNYSTIVLADDDNLSDDFFERQNFLSVCDRNGVVQRYNVEYSAYDSTTRTFTLESGQAIADGAMAAGDFVTLGKYSTTHSPMPRLVDRYRINYAAWKVMRVVSNSDSQQQGEEVAALEEDIVKKLKNTWHGILEMPIPGVYA